ncbi:NAD-dependent epimerase/dehydratase family protein [Motilimonas sp. KMU-193]|uniref:NAD-dependent epimerase/dehydratase family protein n=1 Tax=Motilimonas sp. KMU-193 TaxID=3388668 RepID=UPI00396B01A9
MVEHGNSSSILVTGANGFVGNAVCEHLLSLGHDVVGVVRAHTSRHHHVLGPDLSDTADWHDLLEGKDVVIHCAARVHIMNDESCDPSAEYQEVNTSGTIELARQAIAMGVKRFIFISSIKVNGEETLEGAEFTEEVIYPPEDPYGRSKYDAELGLISMCNSSSMAVTIIRPPLIYGLGVKANFATMINWVRKGIPLPFAKVQNRRSLLALPNLCDFIAVSMHHPAAINQVFLIADTNAYSTSELLQEIAKAYQVQIRLFYIPKNVLFLLGKLLSFEPKLNRLYGSLVLSTAKSQQLLQWTPPYSLSRVLAMMASSDCESR